ncbi:hypothetical protein IJ531_01100, partial [bacterium]|nr:hypothetical protein [bacterium]
MTLGSMVKKSIALALVLGMFNTQILLAEGISGYVHKDDTKVQELDKKIFTGETEKLDKKDTINLTVSQILSSGYTIEGDEFFAEVSQDVEGEKGII